MKDYKGLRNLRFEAYFASMPLHAWMLRGRKTRRAYLNLKESQSYSKEEINQLQLKKLQNIIYHAYTTSNFYKAKMDNLSLHPRDISTLAD